MEASSQYENETTYLFSNRKQASLGESKRTSTYLSKPPDTGQFRLCMGAPMLFSPNGASIGRASKNDGGWDKNVVLQK